jgi:hypothetical protein
MTLLRLNFAELIAKTVGMQAVLILSLFLPAGTVAWPTGCIYVAISLSPEFGNVLRV